MWDELNKFDRSRFAGTNALLFSPPWGQDQIDWWREHMFEPHGIYPDDLGEMLSASVDGPKVITLLDLSPKTDLFVIRVNGSPGEVGEVWWHQRSLDLKGRLFRAEKMVVPLDQQRRGKGRLLMADLVDLSVRLKLRQIAVEAQDVGRYVWARLGFVPDRTAWKYHVQIEAQRRLIRSKHQIGHAKFDAYLDLLGRDDPRLIREVARWGDPVDSLTEFDQNGNATKVAIGKAVLLETSANWFGTFDLEDEETMRIFREYVGRHP